MDCITFSRNIERYLASELSDSELNDFLLHANECASCHKELETNFIVSEGIRLLASPDANYDLTGAFSREMLRQSRLLRLRKLTIRLSYISGTLMFWALVCAVFVYARLSLM